MSTAIDATFAAFNQDYVGNLQQEYLEYINTANDILEREKAAVTVSRKNFAKAAATVAVSEDKIDQ